MRSHHLLLIVLSACADPTAIEVELSPSVISSLDGTTAIAAFVRDDTRPFADTAVRATVTYTDRNGTPHEIAPIDGRTDDRGVFHATVAGLTFDGTGTVTVETGAVSGTATFSVLDRTPPVVEILTPTVDLRVGPGLPLDVQVSVTDEIGISQISFSSNFQPTARTTIVASGALDTTQLFRTTIPAGAPTGPSIEFFALAGDLSGNLGVSDALTLTVDPSITIMTPPDLQGSLLVEGSLTQLVDPRAIVFSTQDNHLYVADDAGTGACNPSCIWRVDATTGAIDPTPVIIGAGIIEGVAVDATANQLLFSDRQNRIGRLTWNGTAYANPELCVDPNQQVPQDPLHLVSDATLGVLVADPNNREVVRVATCTTATVGTAFSINGNFQEARGMALGVASDLYVSHSGSVSRVDLGTGAVTLFAGQVLEAYGLEWIAGTSAYANSLLVATLNQRVVTSTTGATSIGVAFLRNSPIDIVAAGGTLYIVTTPSNGNRARIYRVTGF